MNDEHAAAVQAFKDLLAEQARAHVEGDLQKDDPFNRIWNAAYQTAMQSAGHMAVNFFANYEIRGPK